MLKPLSAAIYISDDTSVTNLFTPLVPILLIVLGIWFFVSGVLSKRFGYSRKFFCLAPAATLLAAVIFGTWGLFREGFIGVSGRDENRLLFAVLCRIFMVLLSVPFVLKVYAAWTGKRATLAEKSPGGVGFSAWLSPTNVILAVLISASAAGGYQSSFFGIFSLLIICLLVQPMISSYKAMPSATETDDTLSVEREKILSLLEVGIITADECADLLGALSSSSQPSPSSLGSRLTPQRRLTIVGAALLLLAFFLPWFSTDFRAIANQLPEPLQYPVIELLSNFKLLNMNYQITGNEVAHGLGWLVLLLGVGTASLPYIAPQMDLATRRTISSIGLGIGGLILIYLTAQNLKIINIGLPLAIVAYILEFLGVMNPSWFQRMQKVAEPEPAA